MSIDPKRFAVIRRWEDNPTDFQVVEYMATREEAAAYVAANRRSTGKESRLEVAVYGPWPGEEEEEQ